MADSRFGTDRPASSGVVILDEEMFVEVGAGAGRHLEHDLPFVRARHSVTDQGRAREGLHRRFGPGAQVDSYDIAGAAVWFRISPGRVVALPRPHAAGDPEGGARSEHRASPPSSARRAVGLPEVSERLSSTGRPLVLTSEGEEDGRGVKAGGGRYQTSGSKARDVRPSLRSTRLTRDRGCHRRSTAHG